MAHLTLPADEGKGARGVPLMAADLHRVPPPPHPPHAMTLRLRARRALLRGLLNALALLGHHLLKRPAHAASIVGAGRHRRRRLQLRLLREPFEELLEAFEDPLIEHVLNLEALLHRGPPLLDKLPEGFLERLQPQDVLLLPFSLLQRPPVRFGRLLPLRKQQLHLLVHPFPDLHPVEVHNKAAPLGVFLGAEAGRRPTPRGRLRGGIGHAAVQ